MRRTQRSPALRDPDALAKARFQHRSSPPLLHATDYLKSPDKHPPLAVVVVFGDQGTLKRSVTDAFLGRVLGSDADDDLAVVRMAGKEADWTSVNDELHTISMFGDHRVVQIDQADDFVSTHRSHLEDLVNHAPSSSTLILDVSKFPKTTRLAKQMAKTDAALAVECSALSGAKLNAYLKSILKERFDKTIAPDALQLLTQLVGDSLGLLEQELDKLASFAGTAESITADDVRSVVGGWRIETTWKMLDAVRDGDADSMLLHLADLLQSGEAPQKLLGGITFSYRKLAKAVELSRLGSPLGPALKDAGVYFRDANAYQSYLRRVTRKRAELFLYHLQKTDSGIKGGSALDDHTQLEQLLIELFSKPGT